MKKGFKLLWPSQLAFPSPSFLLLRRNQSPFLSLHSTCLFPQPLSGRPLWVALLRDKGEFGAEVF